MKKQICFALGALMLLGTFSGCGKKTATVETTKPEVPQAVTEALTEAVAEPEITYAVPGRFTGDWTGIDDTFTVHADAEIDLPDLPKLCTATLERREFSQADVDKLLSVLMKGNPLYEEVFLTKQMAQEIIDEDEAILRGEKPYPADGDGSVERLPEVIAYYKDLMDSLPNEGEKPLAETRLDAIEPSGSEEFRILDLRGYAEVDGVKRHMSLRNSDKLSCDARVWRDGYGNNDRVMIVGPSNISWTDVREEFRPTIALDAAKAQAEEILKALGLDFIMESAEPIVVSRENYEYMDEAMEHLLSGLETGYRLTYVRMVNGLPIITQGVDGDAHASGSPDTGCFPNERVNIVIGEEGLLHFLWEGPYTEPQVEKTNAELLPFEDIRELFGKMYFVANERWRTTNEINGKPTYHEVTVEKVQLCLMRLRDPHTLGPGRVVPVWDFVGTEQTSMEGHEGGDPEHKVLLTVNALDGTVYNRELGY